MGSLVPFQDLNLQLETTNFTSTPTPTPRIIPKIEPNLNPLMNQYKEAFAGRMQHFGDVEVVEHQHSRVEVVEDADSHAIVPVNDDTQASEIVIARKRYPQRSSELVRVTDLEPDDQRYLRDAVRRTRMLFDSLRILSNNQHWGPHRRRRGDLKACEILRC
ncbi:histone-lysine N-methyltransferase family member SUVH9-like [Lycium barbarum]|uniref:histone-lysine N-methyltransferase family member SUVH9-like n=1 Tax=Lycium barbarum TaxID=112863 RepID=UPI00293F0DCA|nr:histone-lysine N-methyltransferase family member SUVH9-like [Lycium barbarum]